MLLALRRNLPHTVNTIGESLEMLTSQAKRLIQIIQRFAGVRGVKMMEVLLVCDKGDDIIRTLARFARIYL